jgi:hypothetical protein
MAARGRGQPGPVPRLEKAGPRLCPGGRYGPKFAGEKGASVKILVP